MNARTYLVTAGALIVLAVPAVQSAGAQIPAGERLAWAATSPVAATHQVKGGSLKATHRNHAGSSSAAIRASSYNAYAYVNGGASQRVAKAITKAGSSSTAIRVGAYNAHAYVNGGASQRVAKAITKAGKKTVAPRVALVKVAAYGSMPFLAGGIPEPCLLDNICTDLQSCELWGLNCELVQPVAPVVDAVPVETVSTEAPSSVGPQPCVSQADANSLIDYPDGYDLSC